MTTRGTSAFTLATGGTVTGVDGYGLSAYDGSTVTVSGGTFIGGAGCGLRAYANGTINLFSLGDTPFLINGVPMNNTTLGQYQSGTDTISGTLLNGDTLNTTFYDTGTINLNVGTAPAPEPSQSVAFLLGTLGLSGLALRARKRTIA